MKSFAFTIAAAIALSLPSLSVAQEGEGRRVSEQLFEQIAGSPNAFLDQGAFTNYGRDAFAAMDYDQNNKVSLGEFLVFDTGMRAIAEAADRLDSHETAMRVVFAFWDRDGDGALGKTEMIRSLGYDFQRADQNSDARLHREEFLNGFTIMVALRAAINPAPID
jgi:hypothetical protein